MSAKSQSNLPDGISHKSSIESRVRKLQYETIAMLKTWIRRVDVKQQAFRVVRQSDSLTANLKKWHRVQAVHFPAIYDRICLTGVYSWMSLKQVSYSNATW